MSDHCDGAGSDGAGADVESAMTVPWVKSARDGQEHLFQSTGDDQPPRALCGHLTIAQSPLGEVPGPRCWACLALRIVQCGLPTGGIVDERD